MNIFRHDIAYLSIITADSGFANSIDFTMDAGSMGYSQSMTLG